MTDSHLFSRLRAANAEAWRLYIDHPFVRGLATGTLPEACFRHYLEQDYLFLLHFARAYGLAVFKSPDLVRMRAAQAGLAAILDQEIGLHIAYCQSWGVTAETLETVPEAPATLAYTRYVLERGLSGDLLDLKVALAPCIIGYGEIGAALIQESPQTSGPGSQGSGNPYQSWIDMYAGEAYQQVAAQASADLDSLAEDFGGEARFASLCRTFDQATRLEIAFWQAGLDLAR